MNPRSASVTSIAASMTRASTSSSTRDDPIARRPSRSVAIFPKSTIPVVGALRIPEERSSRRKTISTPTLLPSWMTSPWASACSAVRWPLTNVPQRDWRSVRMNRAPARVMDAWSRETSVPCTGRSQVSPTADREDVLRERHDAPAMRIGDLEPGD